MKSKAPLLIAIIALSLGSAGLTLTNLKLRSQVKRSLINTDNAIATARRFESSFNEMHRAFQSMAEANAKNEQNARDCQLIASNAIFMLREHAIKRTE